ncbi:hypothetical protein EV356DRAFT_510897 [Viridothelium virens]|uniref:CCHC-type domain-containing protein n=1 Tax=Viridothelium virens TaxID=1048519 RepID=A0A6A6GUU5_VIRVR|nr:hypothetical protein EV356DRAFT_510911 [Viridothelium virens]KAF2229459.1 hypothetical protein EV356DRAFT_510897 [Viridothelium virens]
MGPVRTSKRTRNLSTKVIENSQLSHDALDLLDLESEGAEGLRTQIFTLIHAQVHELRQKTRHWLQEQEEKWNQHCKKMLEEQEATLTGRFMGHIIQLKKDVEHLKTAQSQPLTTPPLTPPVSTEVSPQISYASIATATATPAVQSTSQSQPRPQPPRLDLDLSATSIEVYTPKNLQEIMNKLLEGDLNHIRCQGVALKNKERVGFFFRNQEQVQRVQAQQPWASMMEYDLAQARLITSEHFKVKITGIDKNLLGSPEQGQKINNAFIRQINQENGISIQIARLLNPHSARSDAQIVATCSSAEERNNLLTTGILPIGNGNIAYVQQFHESRVKACRHCGEFDHFIRNCANRQKCLQCTASHSALTGTCDAPPRCFNCLGNHHTTDRNCPVRLRRIQHE